MKKTITESQLRNIIAESVKKVFKEAYNPQDEDYLGYRNGDPKPKSKEEREKERKLRDKNWDNPSAWKNTMKEGAGLNTKGNVPARINHNNKYPTSDEANASGFKKAEYQDFNKPYDIWHKGKETMKVIRDKNPKVSPSGYSWNGKPLEESYIRNAVSESIKKTLKHINEDRKPIQIGDTEDGRCYYVEISNGGLSSQIFYAYAYDEQEALDAVVDYCEEQGWNGLFWDGTEEAEEYPDDFVTAGNHSHQLRVDCLVVHKANR